MAAPEKKIIKTKKVSKKTDTIKKEKTSQTNNVRKSPNKSGKKTTKDKNTISSINKSKINKKTTTNSKPIAVTQKISDTLRLPDIKAAVNKTKKRKEVRWTVFFASLIGIMIIVVILMGVARYYLKHYEVDMIYVEGNVHYSNQEIIDMVMKGPLGYNSLYLGMKYKEKAIEDVPFVQQMSVEILDPTTIRINVYEKALAGCFEHLGKYVYFDNVGTVVEISDKLTSGVPLVTGLDFDYVVVYEKLPIEKQEIFEDILDITQLLNKYEISADRIYIDRDGRKTLYFNKVRVTLGSSSNIDEKILKLKYILPELTDKSGVLRLDNYSNTVKNITFEVDKE